NEVELPPGSLLRFVCRRRHSGKDVWECDDIWQRTTKRLRKVVTQQHRIAFGPDNSVTGEIEQRHVVITCRSIGAPLVGLFDKIGPRARIDFLVYLVFIVSR